MYKLTTSLRNQGAYCSVLNDAAGGGFKKELLGIIIESVNRFVTLIAWNVKL